MNKFFKNIFSKRKKDDWEPVWVDFIKNPSLSMGGDDTKLCVYEIWFSKSRKAYDVRMSGAKNEYMRNKAGHVKNEFLMDLAWQEVGIYIFGQGYRWNPDTLKYFKEHFFLLRHKDKNEEDV